jgi:hypothetical protein
MMSVMLSKCLIAFFSADNVNQAILGLGGTDATITIPSVRILQSDGITLKGLLSTGPLLAELGASCTQSGSNGPTWRCSLRTPFRVVLP